LDESKTGEATIVMTTAEYLALGERIAQDPTCRNMMIGDPPRPLTNVEMQAMWIWAARQVDQRVARDGCCGGPISESGRCPETGRACPLFLKAKTIERRTFQEQST